MGVIRKSTKALILTAALMDAAAAEQEDAGMPEVDCNQSCQWPGCAVGTFPALRQEEQWEEGAQGSEADALQAHDHARLQMSPSTCENGCLTPGLAKADAMRHSISALAAEQCATCHQSGEAEFMQ